MDHQQQCFSTPTMGLGDALYATLCGTVSGLTRKRRRKTLPPCPYCISSVSWTLTPSRTGPPALHAVLDVVAPVPALQSLCRRRLVVSRICAGTTPLLEEHLEWDLYFVLLLEQKMGVCAECQPLTNADPLIRT